MQLRLTVEYEGTAYRGWQLQPDGPTVQAVLEQALSTALRERVRVRGAGRTDAGVHACGQIAAVRVREVPADLERLQKSLNALTPDDVAVRDITVVDDAFDPRRHARSRVYEYRIWNVAAPSPFWRRHAWHVPSQLDVAAMDEAARVLEGEHDFASFRAADAEPGSREQPPGRRSAARVPRRGDGVPEAHGAERGRYARRGGPRRARGRDVPRASRGARPDAGGRHRTGARARPRQRPLLIASARAARARRVDVPRSPARDPGRSARSIADPPARADGTPGPRPHSRNRADRGTPRHNRGPS